MTKVKRLGVLSVANVSAIVSAIVGLIARLLMTLFSALASAFGGDFDPMGFGLGFFGIILFPILYGVLGWIGGVICAALYNLGARWVGGIQVELEQ